MIYLTRDHHYDDFYMNTLVDYLQLSKTTNTQVIEDGNITPTLGLTILCVRHRGIIGLAVHLTETAHLHAGQFGIAQLCANCLTSGARFPFLTGEKVVFFYFYCCVAPACAEHYN